MNQGFYLSSLGEAVVAYRQLVDSDTGSPEGCLPVWADGGGGYYVVDLSVPSGPVREFAFAALAAELNPDVPFWRTAGLDVSGPATK